MKKTRLIGAALVIIGFVLLIVFPIIGIFAGEYLIMLSVVGGWIIALIGAGIIIVSLIFERIEDKKKEKFDKNY